MLEFRLNRNICTAGGVLDGGARLATVGCARKGTLSIIAYLCFMRSPTVPIRPFVVVTLHRSVICCGIRLRQPLAH